MARAQPREGQATGSETGSEASTSERQHVDLYAQLKRKLGVGVSNWDRYRPAADEENGPRPYVPQSGAHVRLSDLARDPSTIDLAPDDASSIRDADAEHGGWVGRPDPAKYAPGTTHLPPKELKEELAKGTVMLWKDYVRQVEAMKPEEREALVHMAAKYMTQERMFVTLEDGRKVSLWDLYQYAYENPERDELLRRGRRFPTADPADPAGRPLPAPPASGLALSAGLDAAVMTPEEAVQLELDWGQIASGSIWRRRPTRWLRGVDGLKDWEVEVYTHEPMANQLLGRKYGGLAGRDVLSRPDYAEDVVRCGPLLGMTFVLTAARDLPIQEAASTWRGLLSSYLQRQAPLWLPRRLRPTEVDMTDIGGATWPRLFMQPTLEQRIAEAASGADELGVSWRQQGAEEHAASVREGVEALESLPHALFPGPDPASWPLSRTPLVDRTGLSLLKGAALWLTLGPEGGVKLQAQSPGKVGQVQSFLLEELSGQEALAGAVMDAFLGRQPVDEAMAAEARRMLLLPVNGFTAGNKERDPNHPLCPPELRPPPRMPANPSAFRLPPAGPRRQQQAETVLSDLRDSRVAGPVNDLLGRAALAAQEAAEAGAAAASAGPQGAPAAVEPAQGPGSEAAAAAGGARGAEAEVVRRQRARDAAAAVLREGLPALGPDGWGLLWRTVERVRSPAGGVRPGVHPRDADVFFAATSLLQEEGD